MIEQHDVRWKQWFQNFEKAFLFFQTAVEQCRYSPIEVGGNPLNLLLSWAGKQSSTICMNKALKHSIQDKL